MSAAHRGNTYATVLKGRPQSPEHLAKRVASRRATLEARKLLSTTSLEC